MKPSNDLIKEILKRAKPDEQMMLQAIRQANETIKALVYQNKLAEDAWNEQWTLLCTLLNKFGREIVLGDEDMIALSPHDYKVTVEPEEGYRIVRLRHITDGDTAKDDQPD